MPLSKDGRTSVDAKENGQCSVNKNKLKKDVRSRQQQIKVTSLGFYKVNFLTTKLH